MRACNCPLIVIAYDSVSVTVSVCTNAVITFGCGVGGCDVGR